MYKIMGGNVAILKDGTIISFGKGECQKWLKSKESKKISVLFSDAREIVEALNKGAIAEHSVNRLSHFIANELLEPALKRDLERISHPTPAQEPSQRAGHDD